jgi:hypothetical protein
LARCHGEDRDAPIAITGLRDGKNVEWLEKVSDQDYLK